jgi:S1-C subfamily serine protease
MLAIDLVVGLLIAVAAVVGGRLGVERALPIAGGAAGILLGSRMPLLFGKELDSDYAVNIAVPAALLLGGAGAVVGELIARRTPQAARGSLVVDAGLGAILAGAAAAVVVWALAPAASEIRSVRDDVRRSEVLERFNAVLMPVRPAPDKRATGPAPAAARERSRAKRSARAIGDPRLLARPEVKRAQRSLVKIVTNRCGGGYQGTGWIASHGVVVTNAHVVSAAEKVSVYNQGRGQPLPAQVIWFDGIHDLAVLRVRALRSAPALRLTTSAPPSTPGASLGFPSGKLTIRRAQVRETTDALNLPKIELASEAGISLTMKNRLVTVITGLSGPGASGGPVIDRRGNVVATVFAGITQSDITLTVPNRIVRSALRHASHPVEVPSCNAAPLKPTRAESLAARNR